MGLPPESTTGAPLIPRSTKSRMRSATSEAAIMKMQVAAIALVVASGRRELESNRVSGARAFWLS